MRIFLFLLLAAFWASYLSASPSGDMSSEVFDLTSIQNARPTGNLQYRRRGASETIIGPKGWRSEIFAHNLGHVIDIGTDNQGHLYALSVTDKDEERAQRAGRVYRFEDRDQDGAVDVQRIILDDFVRPEAMVVSGDVIYIADQHVIWRYNIQSHEKAPFVSLDNIQPQAGTKVLLAPDGELSVYFSYTAKDGQHNLVAIDKQSGTAKRLSRGGGTITAMARANQSALWAVMGDHLLPLTHKGFDTSRALALEPGVMIRDMMVPGQYVRPKGFEAWRDAVLLVQGGGRQLDRSSSGGQNIVAIPTEFGQPQPRLKVLADGMVDKARRFSWGEPYALHIDARGLFIAEARGGTIWRLYPAQDEAALQDKTDKSSQNDKADHNMSKVSSAPEHPDLLRGSSIEQGSAIVHGSKIPKVPHPSRTIPSKRNANDRPEERE